MNEELRPAIRSLNAFDIAWHVGDTFIRFDDLTPIQQWERIVEMLRDYADQVSEV